MKGWLQLAFVLLVALSIRLPFLDQAFQLDDTYYLAGARHVQTDPLHPARASYIFLGQRVDMHGHPHPPFNVWFLGLVLAALGEVREAPFHAAYLVFTLLASAAAYLLARRFTPHPTLAALLFVATPAFVVHGNGLESDIPFTALWLAAAVAFIRAIDRVSARWLAAAGIALALASLAAYQAVLLAPVLAVYAWQRKRRWRAAYAVALLPFAVTAAYQLYDRMTSGALPAAVLVGHFQNYRLQSAENKLRNALALTAHLAWVLFPLLSAAAFARRDRKLWLIAAGAAAAGAFADPHPLFWLSFALGVAALAGCARGLRGPDADGRFLCAWVLAFFAGAMVVFFAGAARYLLPIVPAVAFLAVRAVAGRRAWLAAAVMLELTVSLGLAWSHYQWSNAYRDFMRTAPGGARAFINGEWGFQYYGIEHGARPLRKDQQLKPGDWLLTSHLGYPVPFTTPGGRLRTVLERPVVPSLPLRLIGLSGHSAFSTITFGVRPFGLTNAPADVLTAEVVEERVPAHEYLEMNAPEAGDQIVSGLYQLEDNRFRWTAATATVQLKRPEGASRLEASFYVPEQAAARRVTLALDGATVAELAIPGPGVYTISAPVPPSANRTATVGLTADKTFSAPGDERRLGVILNSVGFRPR